MRLVQLEVKLDMLGKMEGGGGNPTQILEMFDEFAAKMHKETDDKIKAVKDRM